MVHKSKFKEGDRFWFTYAGPRFKQEGSVAHVRKDGLLIVHFDADPLNTIVVVQPYEIDPIITKKTREARETVMKKTHHATKKSSAQLDREIAEVVPGWAKGLDLSESRALAQRLQVSQAELEAKQRQIESTRLATLPSLSITDTANGIFVRVSSPGIGYSKYRAAVDALKAFQIPIGSAIPPNIFIPVSKTADKPTARAEVEEALRHAGYRV